MLLLKNGIKSIFSNLVQVFSIFFLLLLSFSLFIGIYNSSVKYEKKFYEIVNKGKLNDFFFSYKDIIKDNAEKTQILDYLENSPGKTSKFVNDLEKSHFSLDTDTNIVYQIDTSNFKVDNKSLNSKNKKKDFFTFFFISNSNNINLSLDYQSLDKTPSPKPDPKNPEIFLSPIFANFNNIKIGSTLKIENYNFKVKGFDYLPQFCYYDFKTFLFPTYSLQSYIVADPSTLATISPLNQNFQYCYKFKDKNKINEENFYKKVSTLLKDHGINNLTVSKPFTNKDFFTNIVQTRILASRIFTFSILFIIIASTELLIIFFTKRKIEINKPQIGILKSLGYKNYQLVWNYLPFSISLTTFAFIFSLPSLFLINYFVDVVQSSFYSILVSRNEIIWWIPLVSFILVFSIIFLLTLITSYFMLKENVLSMIFGKKSSVVVNRFLINIFFWKRLGKTPKIFSFNYRLRTAIFLSSLKKNLFVFGTSTISSFLILLSLVGVTFLKSFISNVNDNINFSYSYQLATVFDKKEGLDSQKNIYLNESDQKYNILPNTKNWKDLEEKIENKFFNNYPFFIENNKKTIVLNENNEYCIEKDCKTPDAIFNDIKYPISENYKNQIKNSLKRLTNDQSYKLCYKCVFIEEDDLTNLNFLFFYNDNNFLLSTFNETDKERINSFLPKLSQNILDETNFSILKDRVILNIVASKKFQLLYNCKEGDTINFKINNLLVEINIKKIVETQDPSSVIYLMANDDQLSELRNKFSSINLNQYSEIFSHNDNNYKNEYDSFVNIDNTSFSLNNILILPTIILTISKDDILNAVKKNVNFISISFYIFSFFSSIISFFILLSISNLILSENAKLIIILKSVGYKNKEINLLFFTIYFSTVIIGIITGIILNYFIMNLIVNKVALILKIQFYLPFTWWIILITFFSVILIFILTFFITKNIIKKLKYYQT
ncbi:FtsX-like permease family protein [symbiont of Argiope bruennichi]|uniref:FtsX-like permease family protein n=1 Tax=symbiont of Argiope bruennichi TaxID=2810479 RepID=UPI003DA27F31